MHEALLSSIDSAEGMGADHMVQGGGATLCILGYGDSRE
jgi:hypothetical protein